MCQSNSKSKVTFLRHSVGYIFFITSHIHVKHHNKTLYMADFALVVHNSGGAGLLADLYIVVQS